MRLFWMYLFMSFTKSTPFLVRHFERHIFKNKTNKRNSMKIIHRWFKNELSSKDSVSFVMIVASLMTSFFNGMMTNILRLFIRKRKTISHIVIECNYRCLIRWWGEDGCDHWGPARSSSSGGAVLLLLGGLLPCLLSWLLVALLGGSFPCLLGWSFIGLLSRGLVGRSGDLIE